VPFTHRVGLQGVQWLKNSLESSKFPKLRGDNIFIRMAKLRVESRKRREERRTKVEAFGRLGNFPSIGRKCRSSGGSSAAVRSAGEKKIWTVGFHVQERAPEEAHGKKRSAPSDLEKNPRQPSDWARSAQRRGDCGPSDVHTESRKSLDREKMIRV
jgi:hypothetical protein